MKLVVGLGNPGKQYAQTRHNIGFDVIEKLCSELDIISSREKFNGIIDETIYNGEKVLLLRPLTFMNLSGNSIIEVVNFYKLDPKKDVIVIYDDMDLPLGKIRIRERGSSGGHNGIKSIISHIGDEFLRIRCGIGKSGGNTINFVLGMFNENEQKEIDEMIKNASACTLQILKKVDLGKIMQKYNRK